MATKAAEKDLRDVIHEHIKNDDRSLLWLSNKTGIPYGTIYSIFKHKIMELTPDRKQAINNVLGTTY
jgi:hypothetical protein